MWYERFAPLIKLYWAKKKKKQKFWNITNSLYNKVCLIVDCFMIGLIIILITTKINNRKGKESNYRWPGVHWILLVGFASMMSCTSTEKSFWRAFHYIIRSKLTQTLKKALDYMGDLWPWWVTSASHQACVDLYFPMCKLQGLS